MKVKNVTIIRLLCSTGLICLLITSSSCGLQPNGWLSSHVQEVRKEQSKPEVMLVCQSPAHHMHSAAGCAAPIWNKEQPSAPSTMGTCGGDGVWRPCTGLWPPCMLSEPWEVPPLSCASHQRLTSKLQR